VSAERAAAAKKEGQRVGIELTPHQGVDRLLALYGLDRYVLFSNRVAKVGVVQALYRGGMARQWVYYYRRLIVLIPSMIRKHRIRRFCRVILAEGLRLWIIRVIIGGIRRYRLRKMVRAVQEEGRMRLQCKRAAMDWERVMMMRQKRRGLHEKLVHQIQQKKIDKASGAGPRKGKVVKKGGDEGEGKGQYQVFDQRRYWWGEVVYRTAFHVWCPGTGSSLHMLTVMRAGPTTNETTREGWGSYGCKEEVTQWGALQTRYTKGAQRRHQQWLKSDHRVRNVGMGKADAVSRSSMLDKRPHGGGRGKKQRYQDPEEDVLAGAELWGPPNAAGSATYLWLSTRERQRQRELWWKRRRRQRLRLMREGHLRQKLSQRRQRKAIGKGGGGGAAAAALAASSSKSATPKWQRPVVQLLVYEPIESATTVFDITADQLRPHVEAFIQERDERAKAANGGLEPARQGVRKRGELEQWMTPAALEGLTRSFVYRKLTNDELKEGQAKRRSRIQKHEWEITKAKLNKEKAEAAKEKRRARAIEAAEEGLEPEQEPERDREAALAGGGWKRGGGWCWSERAWMRGSLGGNCACGVRRSMRKGSCCCGSSSGTVQTTNIMSSRASSTHGGKRTCGGARC
jgi:hypothetical protein